MCHLRRGEDGWLGVVLMLLVRRVGHAVRGLGGGMCGRATNTLWLFRTGSCLPRFAKSRACASDDIIFSIFL